MTLASQPAPTSRQPQFDASFEALLLAPFAGYRRLGYCVAEAVLDWIDSRRPPSERTTAPMPQPREFAR